MKVLAHSAFRNGLFRLGDMEISRSSNEPDAGLATAWKALGADYPRFHRADRLSQLTMLCATPFLHANGVLSEIDKEGIGLLLATNSGSMDSDTRYNDQLRDEGIASPALFVQTLPNIALGEFTIQHKLFGAGLCIAMDRPDLRAIHIALGALRAQGMHHLICGWANIFAQQANATFLAIDTTNGSDEALDRYQALFDTPNTWTL